MKNLAGFRRKPLSRDISGRMLLRPTRVRAKIVRFHISPHGYTKNAPDFTLPNKDTPKTCPILDLNLRREVFQGVCNTPLHGCVQNLAGFRPKSSSQDIWGRMQYAPTRVHEKFDGFHISAHGYAKNLPDFRRKPLSQDIWGRMQYAPTRVHQKNVWFHISAYEYTQNPPSFIFPHTDTPKTHPILDPNLRRRTFRGVCNTPLHGYVKNAPNFIIPN